MKSRDPISNTLYKPTRICASHVRHHLCPAFASFLIPHSIVYAQQGCNHDLGTKNACSTTNYNYAWRDPNAEFRSILGYNCRTDQCDGIASGGCTRVQRFSNVQNTFNGKAIGSSQANNARKINDVLPTVEAYYQPTVVVPTEPPTSSPTSSPTVPVPTKYPTTSPSSTPTQSPTASPTSSPTAPIPTKFPTSPPSSGPTQSPTASPSSNPTTPAPTASCVANGKQTSGGGCNSTECCSGQCSGGRLADRTCVAGDTTTESLVEPTTAPPPGPSPTCGGRNAMCSANGDCCSGSCKGNGRCK